jgi:AbrB family looped-hinge helix DNA binding protein
MSKANTYKVKITSKRQVTFPKHVLEAMNVGPGDVLEIRESSAGYVVEPQPKKLRRPKSLRHLIPDDYPDFDLEAFRNNTYDPSLRD